MLLSFHLDLGTSDNAVQPYMERCKAEIAAGNEYPFEGDLKRLEALMHKMFASEEILSRYHPRKKGNSDGPSATPSSAAISHVTHPA
jgi:hypothetical protein